MIRTTLLFIILFFAFTQSVNAQVEPTATPDAEGIIYMVVQPGDSLWHIVGRADITMEELLSLNNITPEHLIHPGDLLIIGRVAPEPTATTPPTVTPTLPPPTPRPTAVPPQATICLAAFVDLDQNGVHNVGEPLRPAVAFTLFNDAQVVANYITDGMSEPHCLEGLPPGDYKITRSINRQETLTTAGDWTVTLKQGDVLRLDFGSFTLAEVGDLTALTPIQATAVASTPRPPTGTIAPQVGETAVDDSPSSNLPNITTLLLAGIAIALIILAGSLITIWQYRHKQ